MLRKILPLLIIASAFFFISCNSVDTFGDETLSIETNGLAVFLTNKTDVNVYYVLIESEEATHVDINPDYTTWPYIEAGSTAAVPYDEIMGYHDDAKEAWITWRTEENGSGNSQTIKL